MKLKTNEIFKPFIITSIFYLIFLPFFVLTWIVALIMWLSRKSSKIIIEEMQLLKIINK